MTVQKQSIIGHWVLATAVILFVAALSIPQIDKYMVGNDGPNSLQTAGWVAESQFSPIDVIKWNNHYTPDQGPLYLLLLNQWGYLVGHEIAAGRMLTIYCGLLSLAMAYRLGRDAISPAAGNFAIIIMASNAFYSFYLTNLRMYSLLVLVSAIVIWLYLRIVTLGRASRRSDYVALAVACAALVSTHSFGLLLYIILSLYHLLFIRIGRRWLTIAAVAHIGLALGSIHILVMLAQGFELGHDPALQLRGAESLGEVFAGWLSVTTNDSPLLLLLAAAGAALAWRQKSPAWRRPVVLFALLLAAVVVVYVGIGAIPPQSARYWLPGLPIAILFQAAGLYALYRKRKPLGALICLWVFAGLAFFSSADWSLYMEGRLFSYHLPPWHLVSRTAERSGVPAIVIAFRLPESIMWANRFGPVGLREHWFEKRDIEFRWVGAVKWLEEYLRNHNLSGIPPWIVYQQSRTDDDMRTELERTMDELGYLACQRVSLPTTTEMAQYSLVSLDCLPARVSLSNEVEPLRYDFYGAELDADGSRLYFANKWTWRSQDASEQLNISHQLISEDWQNVGQLDIPLALNEEIRQFAIDVSDVPPGRYRLMAIVYDRFTGQALNWQEAPGGPPSMLFLREIEIR